MALMTVNNEEAGDFRSKPRWSAGRKMDLVLRLLRGEKLEELSRELGVVIHAKGEHYVLGVAVPSE